MSENVEVKAVKDSVEINLRLTLGFLLSHIEKVQEIYIEHMGRIERNDNVMVKCALLDEMLRQLAMKKEELDKSLFIFEAYKACLNNLCANASETIAIINDIIHYKGE